MQICERSLNNTQNGPSMPPSPHFVRAEILPSGYLIRPCEGGGSILHIVDHFDLEVQSLHSIIHPCNFILFVSSFTRNPTHESETEVFPLFLHFSFCSFHISIFISSYVSFFLK